MGPLCLCAVADHHHGVVDGVLLAAREHSALVAFKLGVGSDCGLDGTVFSHQCLHRLLVALRRDVQPGDLGSLVERFVVSSAASSLSVVGILGLGGKVAREGVVVVLWPVTVQPVGVAGIPGPVTATDPPVLISVIGTV